MSDRDGFDFCRQMESLGVQTIVCTDISKDGVLGGTNLPLYRRLASALSVDVIASGGISSLSDIVALREIGLCGAILGKALYTGDLDLRRAVAAAKEGEA